MNALWTLGGLTHSTLATLVPAVGQRPSWHLVREGRSGQTALLQHWAQRPSPRDLDRLKHQFLHVHQEGGRHDIMTSSFGCSDTQAWFLQPLEGTPLGDSWGELDAVGRRHVMDILSRLQAEAVPRAWFAEAITHHAGRLRVPRALGEAPRPLSELSDSLVTLPAGSGTGAWSRTPELGEEVPVPLRGRQKEATYLKTLMVGLAAPVPMERLVMIQGETGLGHRELVRWSSAVAQSEGIWTIHLPLFGQETAGRLLGRLLSELLQGIEADVYATLPEATRILARRVESFATIRGGRRPAEETLPVESEELQAALKALRFAHEHHPRLIVVSGLNEAPVEVLDLLRDLAIGSNLAWLFAVRAATLTGPLKAFAGSLRVSAHLATLQLNRIEDVDLLATAGDILGSHEVPLATLEGLVQASLGNRGLLATLLERAQQQGSLSWVGDRWVWPGDPLDLPTDPGNLGSEILQGRLARLRTPSLAALRFLALAETPLPTSILGAALGLAGDPLDEALEAPTRLRLALVQDGQVSLADRRVQDLLLVDLPQADLQRMARALLKAQDHAPQAPSLPSVKLLALVLDEATARARVLAALELPPPSPLAAEAFVHQAMALSPGGPERARLWEFLADAWSAATTRGRIPGGSLRGQSCWDLALDALELARAAQQEEVDAIDLSDRTRVLRKQALLHLRLGRAREAGTILHEAAELLQEHPLHPEQARLCRVVGLLRCHEGSLPKALKAYEEGLHLVAAWEGPESRQDQAALLLASGTALGHKGQLQRGIQTLQSGLRILEQLPAPFLQVQILVELAFQHTVQGSIDPAHACLGEAFHIARLQDDLELSARCHYAVGVLRSLEDSLESSLHHLNRAQDRASQIGDLLGAGKAAMWTARTLSQLGDRVGVDLLLLRHFGERPLDLPPLERGDLSFIQGDIDAAADGWFSAAHHFAKAATTFASAGFLWRERLARLRQVQAMAQIPGGPTLQEAWGLLEQLKAPVEGSGSRYLEMEWHRAHGHLLALTSPTDTVVHESLEAWGQALAIARSLGHLGIILGACVESAAVLLARGERLGARSHLQEAMSTFQAIWSQTPLHHGMGLQGRPDIHRLQRVMETAGMPFTLPEREEPLADWTPTQTHYRVAVEAP